ncbi:unnamed protein product [Effrenium voratum]|nr:unnamed protein product [Effrenium voratum]
MGNQTPEDAQKLVQELEDTLGLKCPLKELPAFEEAELLPGATLWSLESTDKDDPNHAVVLRWQFGRGVEEACFVMVLNKILSSKFFDLLRTQQQLGYIVGMGASPSNHFTYLVAQVQTEFPPDYARSRMDAFFAENFAWLEEGLEEEEFQRCLQGVLSELKMKPKNLSEERLGLRTFSGIRHEFFENHWHGPLAGQVAAEGHIWQMFLSGEEGGGHPRLLRQELVH